MRRRDFIKAAAGTAVLGAIKAPALHAQGAWPQSGRTVKIIVPWPPGAANDALGRLVAQRIQEKFGANTVVENRTGGSGLVRPNAGVPADPPRHTPMASALHTPPRPLGLTSATIHPPGHPA